jgi:hypothetical protein
MRQLRNVLGTHVATSNCVAPKVAARRVGLIHRMHEADGSTLVGLSNRRELGVIDRNSLMSTSKPLACLSRVKIVSPRRASPAGFMGVNLASVCPTGLKTNPAECRRMMTL